LAGAGRRAVEAGQLPAADGLQLRAGLTALMDHADDAFVTAMHHANICGAGVSLLGALIAVLWLPSRRTGTAPSTEPAPAAATTRAHDAA
jgi:hypothetical protein